ncbi:MAG: hypothetical protein M1572_07540 [Gammaproteobacteria bacterium]|nr:hypothetical protein [Gammaproteobacteria bacterium]
MIEDSNFVFNYVPIGFVAEKVEVTTNRLILEAMKGTIDLYVVNQSHKGLTYAPSSYRSGLRAYWHLFNYKYKHLSHKKADMIRLMHIGLLDMLAKGVLTERELFLIHPEGGYYLVGSINPLLRWTTPNFLLNRFDSITLDHVFILRSELPVLKESLTAPKQLDEDETEDNQSGAPTKQEQRELVFFAWLADKDEHTVSQMKKEEVLAELRKINPHLFMGDQKHFFRQQKRIIFQSGRKAEKDD